MCRRKILKWSTFMLFTWLITGEDRGCQEFAKSIKEWSTSQWTGEKHGDIVWCLHPTGQLQCVSVQKRNK